MLKGPPRPFDGMQRIAGRRQEALREETVGSRPVGRISADDLRVGPDEEAVGGEAAACVVSDVEIRLAGAGAGDGVAQVYRFFDDGKGVWKLVQ